MLGWTGLVMVGSVFAAGAVFLLAEALGREDIATAASYAMVPATIFFGVLIGAVVLAGAIVVVATAARALFHLPARAWRRRRRG